MARYIYYNVVLHRTHSMQLQSPSPSSLSMNVKNRNFRFSVFQQLGCRKKKEKKKKKQQQQCSQAEIYAMLSNSLVYKLNYQQATEKKVEHTFIFILRAVLAQTYTTSYLLYTPTYRAEGIVGDRAFPQILADQQIRCQPYYFSPLPPRPSYGPDRLIKPLRAK